VFETGPLSVWFYHALSAEGLPAICIDARHAKAALDMAPKKTDANDADGLAHLAEVGFYRVVRVKGFDSMLTRTRGGGVQPWRSLRGRAAELDRQLLASSRQNKTSALLMPIPGVGAVTASSYVAAIEDPANFKSSRSVGAWLGLTTRR